ncbi:hypothetical protein ACWEFL_15185 [Streptomyces sp. NPDC004838]
MRADALAAPPPDALTAVCARCERPTDAPVPVRWTERSLQYACPHCVPLLTPGPIPGEHTGFGLADE